MRKKNRARRSDSAVSNLAPCRAFDSVKQKLRDDVKKIKQFLLTLPFVIGLLKVRDDIGEKLRQLILAFFDFLSPCWTFLFIKTPKNDGTKSKNETILIEMKNIIIPNPFSEQQSDNGPTSSKSYGSKNSSKFRLRLNYES